MRALRSILAFLLATSPLASAAAQIRTVDVAVPVQAGPTASVQRGQPQALSLPALSLGAPSLQAAPQVIAAPSVSPLATLAAAPMLRAPSPAPAAATFGQKVQSLSDQVSQFSQAIAKPASDGGRGSAEQQFHQLTGEKDALQVSGIDFSPAELDRVSATSTALERAVALAAGSVFPGAVLQVRSRGSSSRLTHSEQNPDYDLMARLPEAWTTEQADAAVRQNLPALQNALAEQVKRETAFLFPGVEITVSVAGPVQLNDPADGRRMEGITMLPVKVSGPAGLLVDADVSFTRRAEYANDYPDYFQAQLSAVRRLGGQQAVAGVLRDVRLAKRLFSDVIGSYKPWKGGPSGVGVEQLIMQSGQVSDSDAGRSVLEVGSFDKFMQRVLQVAYEDNGQLRGLSKAKQRWTVHNAFMNPKSFLDLMSDKSWNRLVVAAKAYAEAKAAGRPVTLKSLRWEKPAPVAHPAPDQVSFIELPAVAPALSLQLRTGLRQVQTSALLKEVFSRMEAAGAPVEKSALSAARREGDTVYAVTLQPASGTGAELADDFRRRILAADPAAQFDTRTQAPAFESAAALLSLRPGPESSGRKAAVRAARKLARTLGLGRIEVAAQPDGQGLYQVQVFQPGLDRSEFAAKAAQFFKKSPDVELAGVLAGPAPALSLRWRSGMPQSSVSQVLSDLAGRVEKSALTVDRDAPGLDGENIFTVTLRPSAQVSTAAAEKAFREALSQVAPELSADPGRASGELPGFKSADAILYIRPESNRHAYETASLAAQGFARRLGLDRIAVLARSRQDGAYPMEIYQDGLDRDAFFKAAVEFFGAAKDVKLTAVALAGRPDAAEAAEAPGALTLRMLERFTTHGPAPSTRGDAYLYAQGAKALPAGLEAAGAHRPQPRLPAEGKVARARLVRRSGRTYVMLPATRPDGMSTLKATRVPDQLAQGLVAETVVDVSYDGKKVRAVRPVGAYAADVIIGRVNADGLLGPLFAEDSAKSLYSPLPVSGSAKAGQILQAFVRPAAGGFEAVPLLDLGRELTPEIAAREIALRHGARGYFEEAVIRQAEAVGRAQDPEADFQRMQAAKGRSEDLRELPFVTIDPVGAGDLDDAYYIRKEADGSYTWYLATADVAQYVKPGTPAFRAAARIGNTFYSMDKDGVSEFPMNHPVVSKSVSSLLAGKDSLAMVSKMRFSASGEFLLGESDVFLGLVRVQGRYTYDQVAAHWRGRAEHGVKHLEQVDLARELSTKLNRNDEARGKLELRFTETEHRKGPDGRWGTFVVEHDPLLQESHRLIEELKVYGNQAIAVRLEAIAQDAGVPHISRVHPAQEERVNERLREELSALGAPWPTDRTLWQYLAELRGRPDLSAEVKETAQMLALRSRNSALYSADDAEGHEGLALGAKAYDHPSTPIRRFSDMYNRALLEAYLEGSDPKAMSEAMLADLKALGFASLEEYLQHLNGREQAARQMDHEVDEFMSAYELAKPQNQGRQLTGYVKMVKPGQNAEALIQLRELPVTITVRGEQAKPYQLLDEVGVLVKGVDLARVRVYADIRKATR